ncbi:hypothetical protein [Thiomicrorhabdus cannonii]|uniref:hypothetical protein n=1 Tax=Thiomicrorhabdus cannonii TaxID=2748011 RepID=UPI0015BA4390|nr:hypothetical protein [Thiomicrorhabdus cannonii]
MSKSKPDNASRELTQEEMDALRKEMKEASKKLSEYFRNNPRVIRFKERLSKERSNH